MISVEKRNVRKKLIVFDLDGTLVNTIVDLANKTGQVAPYNQKIQNQVQKAFDIGHSPNLSGKEIYEMLIFQSNKVTK